MLRFLFIFCAVSYFFVRSSFAGQALYFGTHQQYLSTRAVGMGNAGVALANDESAMFYNPAGLPQLDEGIINLFIKAAADPDIEDFLKDIDDAGSNATAISNLIVSKYGEHYSTQLPSIGGIWARPKWSVAFIPYNATMDVGLHQAVGPAINLYYVQDSTLAFARAWRYKNVEYGRLDYGVTAKLIYRAQLDKIVDIASIANDKLLAKEDANEGMTLDFDFGMLWRLPEYEDGLWQYLQPSLALVVRNIFDYGYFANMGLLDDTKTGDPEKLHRVIDVGSAFKLPKWWVFDTRLAVDVRDMLHPNWTINKGIHAGLEFNWEMASWWKGGWRVGLNQMYFAAGFTGQLGMFKLDLASYGREVGTDSEKLEDRVYMLTASLDF